MASRHPKPLRIGKLDGTRPTVLAAPGNEAAGVAAPRSTGLPAATHVTIPHSRAVESLNVAVAAAPLAMERLAPGNTGGGICRLLAANAPL